MSLLSVSHGIVRDALPVPTPTPSTILPPLNSVEESLFDDPDIHTSLEY